MSGFLSNYAGSDILQLPGDKYWVKLTRFLDSEQLLDAESHLVEVKYSDDGGTVATTTNLKLYEQTMVLHAVLDWNLDDEDGTRWPIDLAHVEKLPGVVLEQLFKHVSANNSTKKVAAEHSFRGANGAVSAARDGKPAPGAASVPA